MKKNKNLEMEMFLRRFVRDYNQKNTYIIPKTIIVNNQSHDILNILIFVNDTIYSIDFFVFSDIPEFENTYIVYQDWKPIKKGKISEELSEFCERCFFELKKLLTFPKKSLY